jgi:hypothetical protein
MAFRKTRDTVQHEQSAETNVEKDIRDFVRRDLTAQPSGHEQSSAQTGVEGEIDELMRRDVVTSLGRQPEDNESERVASNINSVLERVSASSVQEIEKLITELETLRDRLQSESARVQREIVEYASLTQEALQSTKIIAESLMQWRTNPAPRMPSN